MTATANGLRTTDYGRAQRYCSRLARGHYENFTVASLLLPRRLLPHFQAVYAYCRWADDLGDETGGGQKALNLLRWWREELVHSYATYDSLLQYCQNSANPVGHLVLYMGESFDNDRAALADHICTGLQLANFWQDVARDLDLGRVYLPEEDR